MYVIPLRFKKDETLIVLIALVLKLTNPREKHLSQTLGNGGPEACF
jgi:hypothetical protein